MRRGIVVAAVLPVLVACGGLDAGSVGGGPECNSTAQGSRAPDGGVVLMAQAVPTATLLPCVRDLPSGWSFESLEATDRGAQFWLDSVHDGVHALRVAVDVSCDLTGAAETRSEQPGARRFDRVDTASSTYAGQRFYVYPGGCITYDFDAPGATGPDPLAAVFAALGFVTRESVRQQVHDHSDGRLHLDPPKAAS